MGAAGLDHIFKGVCFGSQCVAQVANSGNRSAHRLKVGRNVHRRREGVVGRLRLVDVVVGVKHFARVTQASAAKHVAAVGNDLVDVHVALGSGTGLPNDQRKLCVVLAREDFVADVANELGFFGREDPQVAVGQGRCLFEVGKGVHDLFGHAAFGTDFKVGARALGLGAPVGGCGNVDFAHRVAFNAGLCAHGAKLRPTQGAKNCSASLIFAPIRIQRTLQRSAL